MAQLWIILVPSFLAVIVLLALLPYGAINVAIGRTRRPDGSWRTRRLRAEVRHFGRFLTRSAVVPLAVLAAVQLAVLLAIELSGSGAVLAALFAGRHPEVALHALDVSDFTARVEEAWRHARSDRTVGATLLEHWPLWPTYLIVTVSGVFLFAARRLPRLTHRYVRGVRRRAAASRRRTSASESNVWSDQLRAYQKMGASTRR